MTEETTTEQLAEIEGQAEAQPETQPQPVQVREGRWRTRHGWVRNVTPTPSHDSRAKRWPWRDAKYDQTWTPNGRCQFNCEESPSDLVEYLGPIEPDKTQELPDKTQELQAEYTPPEGWRVLAVGEVLQDGDVWVWPTADQLRQTVHVGAVVGAKQRYIRPIESEPQSEPQPESDTELQAQVAFLKNREVTLATRLQQEREITTRLRGEMETVQNQLGESRQRVAQLEELASSLRTINVAQEKAFEAAGQENAALRNQLAAVKAELVQERLERNRWHNQVLRVTAELDEKTTQCEILQIELDAAQQVPADSPELRQLRENLAEVTQDRDTYRHAHELLLNDVNATHARTKAMTVETIAEWLEPIRLADSAYLANATMQHLPSIMRHLTGLDSHAID